jgi:hypothetical protein
LARSVTYACMSTRTWSMLTWPKVKRSEIYRDITSTTREGFAGETVRLFVYGCHNLAINHTYFPETGVEHNAQGRVVVEALCYKPESRGFETRWGDWIFLIYQILSAALVPGDCSVFKRIEYQKQKKSADSA